MEKRAKAFKDAKIMATFHHGIVMIGCGSIGRALLPMLCKLVQFDSLLIIDRLDVRKHIQEFLHHPGANVHFRKQEITKANYKKILKEVLVAGDMLIDVSYDIGTAELLQYCHDHGVMFLNMSVEEFDRVDVEHRKYQDITLYHRNQVIRKMVRDWDKDVRNPTMIPDLGENPGMISTFCKKGLVDIAKSLLKNDGVGADRKARIRKYIKNGYFKHLAYELGVKTIHITEKDTQITREPRKPGEYVNTWSVSGFAEECVWACSEAGWGTHEKKLPMDAHSYRSGEDNQIYFKNHGCDKYIRSWQRSGPYIGMLVRHGESYSISSRLTLYKEDIARPRNYVHDPLRHTDLPDPVYRPSVYFVYLPCDAGMSSIHEMRAHGYELGKDLRNLYADIISGMDEIACLFIGDFGLWWTGTSLDIKETRKTIHVNNGEINATGMQAAGGMISGIIYAINNPNVGVCYPDDIDYKVHYKIAKMFQGPVHSHALDISATVHADDWKNIKKGTFQAFEV
jgi:homospermidine synthase